jgi:hypothetical protein
LLFITHFINQLINFLNMFTYFNYEDLHFITVFIYFYLNKIEFNIFSVKLKKSAFLMKVTQQKVSHKKVNF